MGEQLPNKQPEALTSKPEHLEALPTPEQAEPLRPGEADPAQKLEQARAAAEQSASETNPIEQLQANEETAETKQPTYINRELKSITLRRELQQIRRRLPAPQRALSRVIHQPAIRIVSEATGKTISRPSGLLGGGLVAFLGSTSYLYLATHLGFTYNYFVFSLLFIGGFIVGLGLELLVWLATASRRHGNE